ncbi:hypothetical protein NPS01_43130 [Nocardioides psychrotolerans]|uniref:Thioesterase-like superfamily protein n=1 Tax=Nocardioides psychrotolerans TaxID=1005945 RepID=A0A1I3Q2J7_9ACTN|nr:hypothetical protein [Nocardioides psychrotolerans]GEP40650.1 hypothetical protein NPS01_43130 [Nocardioides psychrotolerans]SFJ27842.1 hypothetical protein SAMN05216561_12313 [Nocardioides psychrotolerans]
MTDLVVPSRFCGPPSSGNGGWTAGALAMLVNGQTEGATVTVSLRQPPPLDTPMPVSQDDGWTVASYDGRPAVRARLDQRPLTPVEPVGLEEARAAETRYPGLVHHPFATCFACGTARAEGDGLRIFPGRVDDVDGFTRAAATWRPHASTADPLMIEGEDVASLPATWAALDCVGAWGADFGERLMVLGSMTARIDARPRIGEPHVVIGSSRGQDGRKTFTAATLYDRDGRVVGTAEHLWIAVDAAAFA